MLTTFRSRRLLKRDIPETGVQGNVNVAAAAAADEKCLADDLTTTYITFLNVDRHT